jgi:hypothetical protein
MFNKESLKGKVIDNLEIATHWIEIRFIDGTKLIIESNTNKNYEPVIDINFR